MFYVVPALSQTWHDYQYLLAAYGDQLTNSANFFITFLYINILICHYPSILELYCTNCIPLIHLALERWQLWFLTPPMIPYLARKMVFTLPNSSMLELCLSSNPKVCKFFFSPSSQQIFQMLSLALHDHSRRTLTCRYRASHVATVQDKFSLFLSCTF